MAEVSELAKGFEGQWLLTYWSSADQPVHSFVLALRAVARTGRGNLVGRILGDPDGSVGDNLWLFVGEDAENENPDGSRNVVGYFRHRGLNARMAMVAICNGLMTGELTDRAASNPPDTTQVETEYRVSIACMTEQLAP